MIDIDKLRRLAQAATPGPWIATGPSFGGSLPKYLNEVVVDREGDEGDGYSICNTPIGLDEECSDDMAFIAAANPAAISELLDRLEAAETELAELRSSMQFRTSLIGRTEAERDALRAKIAEMEKQEPFDADSDVFRSAFEAALKAGNWPATRQGDGYRSPSTQIAWRIAFSTVNRLKLYALPGAQPVPEKLCYDSRWEISIDYVDGWNAAVDMMRGKSPSWHCPDCCIAFPFGAPKSCPHDDARCNSLLAAAQEAKP